MFLFVQTPFDAVKQSVLRVCAARVCWSGIKSKRLLNGVAVFVTLSTLFSILASLFLPALADQSIREGIQHCASNTFPAQPVLDILLALA